MRLTLQKFRQFATYLEWRRQQFKAGVVKRGRILCGDAKIYYERFGDKTATAPLIFLHGGLASRHAWYSQLPVFASGHTVICIDSRGHGRSTLGSQVLTYSLLASDVNSVMQHLDIGAAGIVGWSDGGNTGLRLALDYPQRVACLVAISANYHPSGVQSEKLAALAAPDTRGQSAYKRLLEPFISRAMHRGLTDKEHRGDSLRRKVSHMWQTRPQLGLFDLEKIVQPSLLMVGEYDDIELQHSKEMYTAIPGATLQIVENVGHGLIYDDPQTVNESIANFLKLPTTIVPGGHA